MPHSHNRGTRANLPESILTVKWTDLGNYYFLSQEKEQLQTDLIEAQRQIDELNKVGYIQKGFLN